MMDETPNRPESGPVQTPAGAPAPAPVQVAPQPYAPAPRRNTAVIVLSIIVAVETTIIVVMGISMFFFMGPLAYMDPMMFDMPSAEEEEMWIRSDEMAMEVGYLITDGDLDGYMELYQEDDPHVDFATVEEEFLEVAEKAAEVDGYVDYMSDMMPMTYEDEATGETIMRVTVSGMDYNGMPKGGRITVHMLFEGGEITLTGKEGRELTLTETMMW